MSAAPYSFDPYAMPSDGRAYYAYAAASAPPSPGQTLLPRATVASFDLDGPTAPRTYVSPSPTSRKAVPAFFAARRPASLPSDEEEDELTEEPPAANATDQEKIEYKRRQNTLAARRSRKRKVMHQQALEEAVERLTREKEVLAHARADALEPPPEPRHHVSRVPRVNDSILQPFIILTC
ncbi:hypothetical protein MIND_01406500 [Mycena indigotica]|uniref:BZIP domain-containing protein n=1 Tax=Mycena indigotica TaxID=2126181 RepID=A0A8H6RW67_9AGAR|nr:uncharacterized protein MIND_01406500 [Mycena indigotica]KAF7288905.1 hypothetical protein MIND_01406500 [Mycena indigotica]